MATQQVVMFPTADDVGDIDDKLGAAVEHVIGARQTLQHLLDAYDNAPHAEAIKMLPQPTIETVGVVAEFADSARTWARSLDHEAEHLADVTRRVIAWRADRQSDEVAS